MERTLGFDKIKDMLISKAISATGKKLCSELEPIWDFDDVVAKQNDTSFAVSYILKNGSLPLGGITDINSALDRVKVGGMLSCEELYAISNFLYVSNKVYDYAGANNFKLFKIIKTAPELEKCINNAVTKTEILDSASTQLFNIRQKISSAHVNIKNQLNNIMSNSKTVLQDNVVTLRNNRYCLPVKQEYKSSVSGMIHDQSSTGATLFIEPMAVVELNNKIKELMLQETLEVERILHSLSSMVNDEYELLCNNVYALTQLDFIFAKAELSITMNASQVKFDNTISIKQARHPLIKNPVPLDICLENRVLVITGPNTGGKTVVLKTIGLFVLMNQAGLHIPAFDNSTLPFFTKVFVDIGDEQSIEQNLSTFSGHIKNISNIIKFADKHSLVLLDELGSGTDPTEGSALAMSILQHFLSHNTTTLVTTHYSELKIYAIETSGIDNASCEFDNVTLQPTYKLLMGIPGRSNAFEIALRTGLSNDIVETARKFINYKDIHFENLIGDLETKNKKMHEMSNEIKTRLIEVEDLKKKLALQNEQIYNHKEAVVEKAKQDAIKIICEAKFEAAELLKQYHAKNFKHAEKVKANLNKLQANLQTTSRQQNSTLSPISKIEIGQRVYISSLRNNGLILTTPDANNDVMLQVGAFKVKRNATDLFHCQNEISHDKAKSHVKKEISISTPSSKLDVRGFDVLDTLTLLDKFLDEAMLCNLTPLTIVHGKGTGALRKAIHQSLKNNAIVKSFRLGAFGEGESGVTIVELK